MYTPKNELLLLDLSAYCVLEQLRIEEAILRVDKRNWCVLNRKPPKAIVMGISSKIEEMINIDKWQQAQVPIIRRFSGGGTVFIDENCLMVSFICNSLELNVPCFPKAVFEWSETFYSQVFNTISFRLRENDYVIGEKKFGGNAQYMTKNRFLHHTSFLWDYNHHNMEYLKIPSKMPEYRNKRDHQEFLCKLKDFYDDKKILKENFIHILSESFVVKNATVEDVLPIKNSIHRQATEEIKKLL